MSLLGNLGDHFYDQFFCVWLGAALHMVIGSGDLSYDPTFFAGMTREERLV